MIAYGLVTVNIIRINLLDSAKLGKFPLLFIKDIINIKILPALSQKLPDEIGISQALAILNISPEGTNHRGIDDAWNIVHILSTLLK